MKENMTFEQAMARLEEIGRLLDGEGLELEQAMKLFEEGCRLTAHCQAQLEQARQQVVSLTEQEERKDEE